MVHPQLLVRLNFMQKSLNSIKFHMPIAPEYCTRLLTNNSDFLPKLLLNISDNPKYVDLFLHTTKRPNDITDTT